MANEQAIEKVKLIKQRTNEGAKGVRDARDDALSYIVNNKLATTMLVGGVQQYNEDCRDFKLRVDNVLDLLVEHPITKLPLELAYPNLKIDGRHVGVCTCLIPSLLFNTAITDEAFAAFLNWFCLLRAGNQIRAFGWGGWEPHTWEWSARPYVQRGDGLYNLEIYNEEFFLMIDRRLAMIRERNLTAVISLMDHCSVKANPKRGYWAWMYWNGKNNVNGTATKWGGLYHWYEEQHQDKPDWVRLGEFLVDYYHRMYTLCMKYWPYVKLEFGNEVRAAQGWHQLMLSMAQPHKPQGWEHFPKFSVQSSINKEDYGWLKKKSLEKVCDMSIHGCCDRKTAVDRVVEFGKPGVKYILSQDGCPPTDTPAQTGEMLLGVLEAGHPAVEFNFRPLFENHGGWKNVLGNEDWSFQKMMATSEPWFRSSGEAFQRYVNQNI